jgi:hypothetical protein
MTMMADKIWIKAGINADELKSLKGRSALYIAMVAVAGLSLSFAGMSLVNIIERLF